MIQQEFRVLQESIKLMNKRSSGDTMHHQKPQERPNLLSHSSMKSTRSLKDEEEAKAAAIQVQLKYHQAEAEMEAAATRMKIEKELDIAKARLLVFKEEEEMSQELGSDGILR